MQKPKIDLKTLRERRGWLQGKAADELGFSRSYLGMVESGRQGISVKMMHAIIRVFGVEYEDFYKEDKTSNG